MTEEENERPISAILQDVFAALSALLRSEIALAKTELKGDAAALLRIAPMFVVGAVLGLFALGYLLTAALLALLLVIPAWAASLCIFVIAGIIGTGIVSAARARWRTLNLKSQKTIRTMKEDAEWLKTQTH
jgi:uncharacterized membrane protein YqjE